MSSSARSTMAAFITEASPTEASFYSLAYVAALRRCAAAAYGAMLKAGVAATAATSGSGDAVADYVVRCRLETEREATERLTEILLHAPPQSPTRVRQAKGRQSPTAHVADGIDVDAADATSPLGGTSSALRSRTASGGGRPGSRASSSSARSSRRVSGKSSNAASSSVRPTSSADAAAKDDGSADAELERGAFPFSSAASPSSALASSAVHTPKCDAAAVLLLRVGLCRALGWPVPVSLQPRDGGAASDVAGGDCTATAGGVAEDVGAAHSLSTQLADTLLSRYSYPSVLQSQRLLDPDTPSAITTAVTDKSVHMYMHVPDTDLRQSIVLEWIEDAFVFALHQGYSVAQTQCVLLDGLLALNLVDGHLPDPADAAASHLAWEQRVADALQAVMCAQTCPTVARTIETVYRFQPVTIQVPDPVQLAEIEEKQLKTTSQKALAALEAAKQSLPLVPQAVMRNVEVEVEREVTLPAVFSMPEVAVVADFITRSVVMHHQLWGVMLAPVAEEQLPAQPTPAMAAAAASGHERPVAHRHLLVAIENVPPVYVPSLAVFHSDALQAVVDAQRRLFDTCQAERAHQFAVDWQRPLLAIASKELGERRVLQAAAAQVDAEDRAAALTAQQCARVERAYGLRLDDALQHNASVVRGAPPAAPLVPPPPTVAAETLHTAAAPAGAGKMKKTKSTPSTQVQTAAAVPAFSADAAASIVLPVDTVFGLAEVEARLERVAAAVEDAAGPGAAAAPASQRGGNRKH